MYVCGILIDRMVAFYVDGHAGVFILCEKSRNEKKHGATNLNAKIEIQTWEKKSLHFVGLYSHNLKGHHVITYSIDKR